ncbi:hypothetical protein HOLleu_06596 [Holothuria leucospilota]|uniref:Uncharacterized protein n=1 Tax=Holothuria leucospilota TaxID=206669 RepID=A0A9Q1HJR1_HOLLE|nr:hypothetical protein HOLleu_06596 [Holothuria leucospilota]
MEPQTNSSFHKTHNNQKQKGHKMTTAFFDDGKASDGMWNAGLLFKLQIFNIPPTVTRWTSNFLTDRKLLPNKVGDTLSLHQFKSEHHKAAPLLYGPPVLIITLQNDISKTMSYD